MNCFDDIPEDKEPSYPCPKCSNGSVTMNTAVTKWVCDSCDFEAKPNEAY